MKGLKGILITTLVILMSIMLAGQVFAKGGSNGKGMMATTAQSDDTQTTSGNGNGKGMSMHHATDDQTVSEHDHGQGVGDGTGPVIDIFAGEPVTIEGTVSEVGYYGEGVQIDTGEEIVTIYGLGPISYWDYLEIARPTVGEEISVDGYEVTFSDGSAKIIAVTVFVGEEEVALRDSETGNPLWRQHSHQN